MSFSYIDLGIVDYQQCHDLQKSLRQQRQQDLMGDLLIFVEHPPVYTLGKRSTPDDFLDQAYLRQSLFPIIQTERGGRVTYHGPGQVVGYVICDLKERGVSIPQWVLQIESGLQLTLNDWGLETTLKKGTPGLWTKEGGRKIASLGFHVDRGVTMHGFSLNVSCNLDHYNPIHPCGLESCVVTNLEEEIDKKVSLSLVKEKIRDSFSYVIQCSLSSEERGGAHGLEPLNDLALPHQVLQRQ